MIREKSYLRKKFLLLRKKMYFQKKKFDFNQIFLIIKKKFGKKKLSIAGYYPSNYEVDVLKFIEQAEKKKFQIGLPVIGDNNSLTFKSWKYQEALNINIFGILEPKKTNKTILPDIMLVPLVAFDNKLNRIGYGKGYYDRGLSKIKKNNKNMLAIGIAYSSQKCSHIPIDKYDFKLDYIFTERGIISSQK